MSDDLEQKVLEEAGSVITEMIESLKERLAANGIHLSKMVLAWEVASPIVGVGMSEYPEMDITEAVMLTNKALIPSIEGAIGENNEQLLSSIGEAQTE